MKTKTNIYIAFHKKVKLIKKRGYLPIQVGAAYNEDLGYLKDSDGTDNISVKNPQYCELTALYYLWKNEKDFNYIGLVHYRRWFFASITDFLLGNPLAVKKIEKIMEEYDVILPFHRGVRNMTVREQFEYNHPVEAFDKCKDVVLTNFPEYKDAFEEVENTRYLYPYNMFVMSKQCFEQYMEWLFAILFKLELVLDISKYDAYNQRMFGFLAERLMHVWIVKNKYKIKEMMVFNTEQNKRVQILEQLKRKKQ